MRKRPVLTIILLGFLLSIIIVPARQKQTIRQQAAANNLPTLGGCQIFPSDNVWNTDISDLPVDPNSANYVNSIGAHTPLYLGTGMPYIVVPGTQPLVPIHFTAYPGDSDPGPYPIPPNAPIEQGTGDQHVLVLQSGSCKLYEMWLAAPQADGSWDAGTGAVFDLNSNRLRPDGLTSADAAGLPMLPGLVRYDEIASGSINHALRFSVPETQWAELWPARHVACSCADSLDNPPMGTRFRLKASVDISSFSPTNRIILTALKKYGMFVADNYGSNPNPAWILYGAPDSRWDQSDLSNLWRIHGSDFEAVDESALQVSPDSAQVKTIAN